MTLPVDKIKRLFLFIFRHFWKFAGLLLILGFIYVARSGYTVKFGNLTCEKAQTVDVTK